MEPLSLPLAAWLAGAVGLIGGGAWVARRQTARETARAAPAPALADVPAEGQIRRIELRMEAMEGLQADFLARLESFGDDGAAERRLQAMASRILGLVRDKDASLDTALAGLDQLRARLRVLEQMGDLAETRGLFEAQGTRLEAMAARLAGLEAATPPFAEIADQMAKLYGQRDAMAETVFARLAPLEAKQRELEAAFALRDPGEALDRLGERLEALRAAQEAADRNLRAAQEAAAVGLGARLDGFAAAAEARLAALEGAESPQAELVERLAALHAQKEAGLEAALGRLAPVEARVAELERAIAAQDPAAALARLDARIEGAAEALGGRLDGFSAAQAAGLAAAEARLAALEGAESPQAELVERLAALHAQKDAGLEAALGRLAPVEARMAELEAALAARDPQAALDRLAERLEALRAAHGAAVDSLRAAQQAAAENLRAAQEAAVENLRAAQEAATGDLRAAQEAAAGALGGRVAALEGAGTAQAEILERLAALHAQKDAGLEAALGRLAPVEARMAELEAALAARDPQAALDRLAERLEALRAVQEGTAQTLHAAQDASIQSLRAAQEAAIESLRAAQAAGLAAAEARLAALEGAESPQAEILERLAALHAQKDAGLEAALGRLAPVEARVAELERGLAWDAKGALDRLAAVLAETGDRLAALEAAGADAEAEAARMEAQAIAAQLVAARTVAEETRLFANRLSLLEASLPRLSIAQALMMQALERQAAPQTAAVWPLVEGMAEVPAQPHLAAVETPAPETWRGVRPVPVPKG